MKILYLNNAGNFAGAIGKALIQLGLVKENNVKLIQRYPMAFYDYDLPWMEYDSGSTQTIESAKHVDIVHICYHASYVTEVKNKYPNKPVIITFGGNDIRDKWGQESLRKHYSKADLITVKTEDLLCDVHGVKPPDEVLFTPIPIDRDFWARTELYNPGTALRIQRWHGKQWIKLAEDFCTKNNLELTQYQRSGATEMRVEIFHDYLQQFEYYIDIKPEVVRMIKIKKGLTVMSGTALQQLSLGGKVYYWDRIIEKFPEEYDAKIQAEKWYKIYQELLN